jgi:hypothetical protein
MCDDDDAVDEEMAWREGIMGWMREQRVVQLEARACWLLCVSRAA